MSENKRETDVAGKPPASEPAEDVESFRTPNRKPKTVRRSPADKMLRPGLTRGFETK